MARHLYTDEDLKKVEKMKRETNERNKSEALLARFRRMMNRDDLEEYHA